MFKLEAFRSKCTVLKKVLVILLGIFGAPALIRRLWNRAPLVPLVTPLVSRLPKGLTRKYTRWQTVGAKTSIAKTKFSRVDNRSSKKGWNFGVSSRVVRTDLRKVTHEKMAKLLGKSRLEVGWTPPTNQYCKRASFWSPKLTFIFEARFRPESQSESVYVQLRDIGGAQQSKHV